MATIRSNNPQSDIAEERFDLLETRMSRLEESVHRAVGDLLPKVDALLSERADGRGSAASFPAPPPTAATPSTSLLELAEQGDGETLLRMLADERVDVRSNPPRTGRGDTALHVAARGGHLKAVIVLLGAGAPVDILGHRLRTPLHCAAVHGHLVITQRLLDAGAKVDSKDKDGATALELASGEGYTEVVCLLLKKTATPNEKSVSMILSLGNKNVVELCLQKGISVDACNSNGESLLVQAARERRWDIVDLLLEKGASPTKCKTVPECGLVFASQDGQADAVRHLLRRGAASNTGQVKRALWEATSAAVVWAFVDLLPDQQWEEVGSHGLVGAAWKGRLEPLLALLEAGVDVDSQDDFNQTALLMASCSGNVECVRELLDRGADVNAKNQIGSTPLHGASKYGNVESTKELLGRGADANAKDEKESTPLHRASVFGHVECVRALLAAGASASARNNEGKTPLQMAETEEVRRAFNEQ